MPYLDFVNPRYVDFIQLKQLILEGGFGHLITMRVIRIRRDRESRPFSGDSDLMHTECLGEAMAESPDDLSWQVATPKA